MDYYKQASERLFKLRTQRDMKVVRKLLDQLPLCGGGCGRHLEALSDSPWCPRCAREAFAKPCQVWYRSAPGKPWEH